ncbi:MAG: prepilin-type N-terminal cleavage/methylation domain-containing protein [Planctomycetia bacterium]|nr:prepilin-type N-terminal cleavage/methylation domain-containing protein [Planctomycetia bacterium]
MRSRGFTLVEIGLTLALMIVVGALVWPALDKPFAAERLRKAADQLRADLTRGRVAAMRSGKLQMLSFDSTTGRYRIGPADQPVTSPEVAAAAAAVARTLPEGIRIQQVAAIDDVTPAPQPAGFSQPSTPAVADVQSSTTIYFHPDGTTSSAQLTLVNEHTMFLRLELRGLTGATLVSELTSGELMNGGQAP